MKDYPNEEAVRKAHRIYLDAMREFIYSYLEKMASGETEELLGSVLNCQPNDNVIAAIDFGDIPHIFRKYWDDFFKQRFGRDKQRNFEGYDIRSVTGLISAYRNRSWAHPGVGDLDPEFTRACLFVITDVLEEIGKLDLKCEVEAIRDELFSDEVEEHPAEVENAALKERLANRDAEKEVPRRKKSEGSPQPRTTVAQRFSRESSVDEIRKISDMMVELRIADDGSRPLSWKNCRAELNLRNDEFHKVIRLSPQYRAAVIARINKLRAREEGWEYRGKLENLTGIEISEEELA